MRGFDIDSLLRFTPPDSLCERCCALLQETVSGDFTCPVCGVNYVASADFVTCAAYLKARGLNIDFPDLMGHSQTLAGIARDMRAGLEGPSPSPYPPMRALLEALHSAQRFVHFTTYGISAMLLGALKLTAQRVDVRGIVSGVKHDAMVREIHEFGSEAPRLELRLYPNDSPFFPHQKIIVIDGLLAFKGSANMTDFGWRRAEQRREVIEPVTNLAEVLDLHNHFFSPAWWAHEGSRAEEKIIMTAFGR